MKANGLLLVLAILALAMVRAKSLPAGIQLQDESQQIPVDTTRFSSEVKPVLRDKCSPCHFPGGKMYLTMPFDVPATLIRYKEGILKRFRDQQEEILLRRFIDANTRP